jgi:tetratricopeptide (TPR) repeat protein
MISISRWICPWVLILLSLVQPLKSFSQGQTYGNKLGTVDFPISCNETASEHMRRGLALLHHMTYDGAEESFHMATEADPNCAMGYWGIAMTFIHPIWPDIPSEAKMKDGLELLSKARTLAQGDKKGLLYIDAVEAYYENGWTRTENDRLASSDDGWRKVYEQFPEDLEAASFYALAHMAQGYSQIAASPSTEKNYEDLEEAGAIVEGVLAKIPDHPGAHHYIIHAYDMEGLADRALEVARNYGKIAPDVPHALHMPSHIFTRLGLWEESIEWNKRSAASALKYPHNGAVSGHYFHALDYLAYAYLQTAQDKKAEEVFDKLRALKGPLQNDPATAYVLAAVPARYYLERQQWSEAAKLESIQAADFPWDRFPQFEAITHFARALGAARSGDLSAAQKHLNELASLRDRILPNNLRAYWTIQTDIQQTSAKAWLEFQQDKPDQALKTMQSAVDMEASTYKHPITPGQVLPARELLADLLLELNRPEEALAEYQTSLKRTPNRFNSLFGAGRASEVMGDQENAASYYGKLVEVAGHAESTRDALEHAKAFLFLAGN